MVEFTLWDIFRNIGLAARWTIALSLVAFIGGGIVGLLLFYLRIGGGRVVKTLIGGYVQVFQGTPRLIQLFLTFLGASQFGVSVSLWLAASVCLMLYSSAYLAEIWRGCVDSVPKGQWEAAKSLALSFVQQLRFIVLPQAATIAVAPTVGFMVQFIKGTARLHHRLRRDHQNRRNDRQRDVPAVPPLQLRRAVLFCAVLSVVDVEQAAGIEAVDFQSIAR